MMTALLVIERGNDLNAEITIPDSLTPEFAAIKADRGHTIGLQAGETVRRIDMPLRDAAAQRQRCGQRPRQ